MATNDDLPFLDADAILGADDREIRTEAVPEWGTSVRLRALSARERDRYEVSMAQMDKGDPDRNFRARLVAAALIDGDGKPMFRGKAIDRLGEKNAVVLDRLFDVVVDISGMGPTAREEAAEAFEPAPDGPSSSG